jgi:hypothetical protein
MGIVEIEEVVTTANMMCVKVEVPVVDVTLLVAPKLDARLLDVMSIVGVEILLWAVLVFAEPIIMEMLVLKLSNRTPSTGWYDI